jgi:predicted MFS family arabinose efflux permease
VTESRARGGLATYLDILRRPVALGPFAAAIVARLPISMAPLGMVLLIQQTTGSYGRAGAVTGAYAVGSAVGAPLWGRALDRWGQPRVVALTAALNATLLVLLAVSATRNAAAGVLLVLGFFAGLFMPPVTPAMRVAWRVALPEPATVRAAYALDAVAVETIFITGPLLLSLLLVISAPAVPLIVTAGLTLVGGSAYAATGAARRAHTQAHGRPDASPTRGGPGGSNQPAASRVVRILGRALPLSLVPVLLTGLCLAVAFGSIDTSLAATARDVLGNQAELGLLFTAIAGGSAFSGLWFGTRDVEHRDQIRYLPFLLLALTGGLVPLSVILGAFTPALWVLLPLLFLTGMGISPTLIILQNLIDVGAPATRVNEGQSWLATSITTGAGAGTAIAGTLIDAAGIPWSFAAAGSAAVTASALAALLRRRHNRYWPPRNDATNRSSR